MSCDSSDNMQCALGSKESKFVIDTVTRTGSQAVSFLSGINDFLRCTGTRLAACVLLRAHLRVSETPPKK